MTDIDWDALSLEELKQIQKQAEKAIASFEARRRKEALAAVEAAAAEMGFTLNDLMGAPKTRASKAAPKYAHPENPALTWSGRGRQPNWVKAALENGSTLDDLLIAK
ncbi:H-NS family nucleoid-associated regulatory protein [Thalassococcus sp. S3]|uniref:H-NS histone family protein n=1 Tax=Thalassococcus sp. S3 TaxID=2017482 RepID=UPI001023FAA0|nr:H-NS histone family protein [Thalassococcus sp. S3]QBF32316.1 transcriptional regulator [Thalassococcus sp. S3]